MMITKRRALLGAASLAAGLLVRGSARADDDAAAACSPEQLRRGLADIARARAPITTLTGPFTQERTIGLLAAKVRSTGTLTLVRPDRLRWELAPPDDTVYWVTPEGLAYKSAAGQGRVPAANQKLAKALEDLRVLLGGDIGSLEARYDVSGTCRGARIVAFRALPRAGTAASFQEMKFTLASDLVSPDTVTIVEGPHDRTEIHFGTIQKNVTVAPALMTPG
jgi:outer membrane lipoprotein-sorting protein